VSFTTQFDAKESEVSSINDQVIQSLSEIRESLRRIEERVGSLEAQDNPDSITDLLEHVSSTLSDLSWVGTDNFVTALCESFANELLDIDKKIKESEERIMKRIAELPYELDALRS
jgi:hypothetical protein